MFLPGFLEDQMKVMMSVSHCKQYEEMCGKLKKMPCSFLGICKVMCGYNTACIKRIISEKSNKIDW